MDFMRIAIIEDDQNDRDYLSSCLRRYESTKENLRFDICTFSDGTEFILNFRPAYDIIFLDIEMPHSNGMEIARRIRETDQRCVLIFTTNMVQYAVQGYEVEAFDFIVKPIRYFPFAFKLDKALAVASRRAERVVTFNSDGQQHRVSPDSIYYLESMNHCITIHTTGGDFDVWHKTMAAWEAQFAPYGFARCGASFLINLKYVRSVSGDEVQVGSRTLPITRGKKRDFLAALSKYMG